MSNVPPEGTTVGRSQSAPPQQQQQVDVAGSNTLVTSSSNTTPPPTRDDTVMLRELAHLTTQPAPFIARAASQSVASINNAPTTTTITTTTAAAPPAITLEEEQQVLDAILDAIKVDDESEDDNVANVSDQLNVLDEAEPGKTTEQQVEQILAHAIAVAAARDADPSRRHNGSSSECHEATVLRFHDHTTLHRSLHRVRTVLGVATCLAMAPPQSVQASRREKCSVEVAVGLSRGAVGLYGPHWRLHGLCGASTSDTVSTGRGAVLALSIAVGGRVVASGHERGGVCVLWSVASLTALRVITDVFAGPLLQLRHVAPHEHRLIGLDRTGRLRLLHCTAVLGAVIVRTAVTRLADHPHAENASDALRVAGFDLMPHPSARYVLNAEDAYLQAYRRDAAHPASSSPTPNNKDDTTLPVATLTPSSSSAVYWSDNPVLVQPNRHLLATISGDAVGLYVIDSGGLQTSVTTIARHLYRPHGSAAAASTTTTEASVCFVVSEPQDDHTARVLLCAVWGTQLELLRVEFSGRRGEAEGLTRTSVLMTESPLRGLAVVGGGDSRGGALLLAVDESDTIRLLAVTAETAVVVESYALGPLDLVHYAGAASTVNTSETGQQSRPVAASYRCALASNGVDVLLLATGRVVRCTVVPWYAQIEVLLLRHRYVHAMELAYSFIADAALVVVGLSADRTSRRRALLPYLRAIIVGYLSDALLHSSTTTSTSENKEDGHHGETLQEAVTRVLGFCSAVDAMGLFWGPAMALLREAAVTDVALRAVEPFVLRDVVTAIPATYLSAFFDVIVHDEEGDRQGKDEEESNECNPQRGVARAERALMHLDTDVDALLRFAATHELIQLTVTLLSVRQGQYVAALSAALDSTEKKEPHVSEASRGVALEYLRCTLHDKTLLPGLDVPAALRVKVKRGVWAYLLQSPTQANDKAASADNATTRTAVPLLRLLRLYDQNTAVVDLLVDSLCEATAEDGEGGDEETEKGQYSVWAGRPHARRTCVGRLLSLLTDNTISEAVWHGGSASDTQGIACAFKPWELARRAWPPYAFVHATVRGLVTLVVHHQLLLPSVTSEANTTTTAVGATLVEVVVRDYLFVYQAADTTAARRELQEQLVRFMRATCPGTFRDTRKIEKERSARDPQATLQVAVAVWRHYEEDFVAQRMARCVAALACLSGDYGHAIDAYLNPALSLSEPDLATDVFALLHEETRALVACDAQEGLAQLRRAVVQRVEALVHIDAAALAHYVIAFLVSHQSELMAALRGSSQALLRYLDALIDHGDARLASEVAVQNGYIELLCEHDPERVYRYLRSAHDHITYDVQRALDAVRRHGITDAAIFLLEKTFRTEEAMQLLQQALLERLHAVRDTVRQHIAEVHVDDEGDDTITRIESAVVASPTWQAVEALLQVGVALCATRPTPAHGTPVRDSTAYWLRLLELVTTPRRVLCERRQASNETMASAQEAEDNHEESGNEDDELVYSAAWLARKPAKTGLSVTDTRTCHPPLSNTAVSPPPAMPPCRSRRSRCFVAVMIALYTRGAVTVLQNMTRAVDRATVVAAVLRAGAPSETLGPFRPLLSDILSALRHERTVSQLAQRCTEADCLRLAAALYTGVNHGIVIRATDCALCHSALRDAPSSLVTSASGAGRGTVCLFLCGHGYHDTCLTAATGSAGSGAQRDCVLCSAASGRNAPNAIISNEGDTPVQASTHQLTLTQSTASSTGGVGFSQTRSSGIAPTTTASTATTATALRRLRQTCARVDLLTEYADVLRSFMTDDSSSAVVVVGADERGAKAAGALVRSRVSRHTALPRSPAPPLESVAVSALNAKPLDLTEDNVIEGLTDADILDLFGDA